MTSAAVQVEWARALLSLLLELGTRDFVVSPGSRSSPLVLALGLLAEERRARVHSIIDERSAGFFALGLARATGEAPVLLCTSGTAPAHYYPAVIEASEARLPLIVVSADRPLALQGLRAPQTIEQTALFGRFVEASLELGSPTDDEKGVRSLLRRVSEAHTRARQARRPLHLNAPFDKPLEAPWPELSANNPWRARIDALLRNRPIIVQAHASLERPREILEGYLSLAKRPLFVLGELSPPEAEAVRKFAVQAGGAQGPIPLLAECSSNAGSTLDVDLAFRGGLAGLGCDRVIQFGGNVSSSRYTQWLESSEVELAIVLPQGLPDPARRATLVLQVPILELVELSFLPVTKDATGGAGARASSADAPFERGYFEAFRELERSTRAKGRDALSTRKLGEWNEAPAVSALLRALPSDATLFVGNSLPLRLVNWTRSLVGREVTSTTCVQRGVNGIDGLIAGAVGLAAAPGSGPVVALIGDVSATHDLGSLALSRLARRKLIMVVLDNGGGRIFDHLPIGRAEVPHYELWTTPPRLDLRAIAAAYGLRAKTVHNDEELKDALETAFTDGDVAPEWLVLKVEPGSTASFLDAFLVDRPSS